MSEIAILSMQRIANYGSWLQAYALKSILQSLGHRVQFADYHTAGGGTSVRGKLHKASEILGLDAPLSHRIGYIRFKQQFASRYHAGLGLSPQPDYAPRTDVLVIGSDEVFNCTQANPDAGYSPELFGAGNRADKVITYAASFGNTTPEKLEKTGKTEEVARLLGQIPAISVRDKTSGDMIRFLTGRTVPVHLDPTLIWDFSCSPSLFRARHPQDYLLVYAYAGRISRAESLSIQHYARQNNLQIWSAGGILSCADRFINCPPLELLSYFADAQAVVTDTFHGTILSVITRRPFAALVRSSRDGSYGNEEKLSDLLSRLALTGRQAKSADEIPDILNCPIDYGPTAQIIKAGRASALEYLARETGRDAL